MKDDKTDVRYGVFTKDELIERVKQEDEVGQMIVDVHLSYLKALKNGTLQDILLHSDEGSDVR